MSEKRVIQRSPGMSFNGPGFIQRPAPGSGADGLVLPPAGSDITEEMVKGWINDALAAASLNAVCNDDGTVTITITV